MEKYSLYQQLADSLRDKIYEGKYAFGDKLPSERSLAEKFGISHLTVRKALAILEEEGMLLRVQGKGTFVRAQKYPIDMQHMDGFSSMFGQQGITITNKVLYSGVREAGFKYSRIFGIPREEPVFELIRLRQNGEDPVALEYNILPTKRVPHVEEYDYSLYSLWDVYRQTGIQLVEENQKLEIVKVYNPQADLLNVEEGADVLILSSTALDLSGKVIEYTKIYDNAKRMVFYASTV
ncbi:GntR family transcriptional regulator [Dorea sp. OM02-2LB]|nr:GntR family transcriptional regulator [Dorea sp. OM02-2LB]